MIRGEPPMTSGEAEFWDRRYRTEGAVWGDEPSPTAELAGRFLRGGERVLEVGCGYGRDVCFLVRRQLRVVGIDPAHEGLALAEARLRREGLCPEELVHGEFANGSFPAGSFDAVLSHRLLHLLLAPEAVAGFVKDVGRVLRPGGLLCLGARNTQDLDPAAMRQVAENVYEYRERPGHRIRYWGEAAFREAFGGDFEVLELAPATELESLARPVPCYLTLLAARKKPVAESGNGAGRP